MGARAVQAPTYHDWPVLTCAYFTYWSDVPVAGAGLYSRPERMIVALPTNDGRTPTIVFFPNDAFHEVRADIEGHFMRVLDLAPQLAERVRNGKRSERFLGTADLPFFFRKSYDPGWALVGDAGYHKDPITAQGIADAFRDAELLIEALDAELSGKLPPEEALFFETICSVFPEAHLAVSARMRYLLKNLKTHLIIRISKGLAARGKRETKGRAQINRVITKKPTA